MSGCPRTQTPTQMLKSGFFMFDSQEIGSDSVTFKTIFENRTCLITFESKLLTYQSKMAELWQFFSFLGQFLTLKNKIFFRFFFQKS